MSRCTLEKEAEGRWFCVTLEMCLANCAATCGCADGNICATAAMFTTALLSLAEAAVAFGEGRKRAAQAGLTSGFQVTSCCPHKLCLMFHTVLQDLQCFCRCNRQEQRNS